ncbi:MAG: hypothetical protein IT291_08535 [Deltaproteobacteria bacterium]|nr:hypothetical protein [Deltaproteobacteria bacterium]
MKNRKKIQSTICNTSPALTVFFSMALSFTPQHALAETTDFGGSPEEYKGDGDLVPPRCQVEAPRTTKSPFSLKWDCTDNDEDHSPKENIKTSAWIRRTTDTRWRLVDHFLGFPASLLVENSILQLPPDAEIRAGLPVQLRIEASDAAGNTTFSPALTVLRRDTELESCALEIKTTSSTVAANDIEIIASQLSDSSYGITSSSSTEASPCELEDVCKADSIITIDASFSVVSDTGEAEGTLTIMPGTSLSVEGNVEPDNESALTHVTLSGTATFDGEEGSVTLICE